MTTVAQALADALERLQTAKREFEDESRRVQDGLRDLTLDVKQQKEEADVRNEAQTKALVEAVQALRDELKEEADARNEAQTKALTQAVQALHLAIEKASSAAAAAHGTAKEGLALASQAQPKGNYLRSDGAKTIRLGAAHMPGGEQIVHINFGATFRSLPVVLVSEVEATAGYTALLASRITKVGFDAVKMMNEQSACHVYWIAIGD